MRLLAKRGGEEVRVFLVRDAVTCGTCMVITLHTWRLAARITPWEETAAG